MKRTPTNVRLTADEVLAANLLSIHDSGSAQQDEMSDASVDSVSHDPLPTRLASLSSDLTTYTANRINSSSLFELPKLLHEIASKRIYVEENWLTAFQNYKQELSQQTVYFHEELGLQITAASERARITTAVQEASSMSLALRTLKESFVAAEKHADYELRVRLFREST